MSRKHFDAIVGILRNDKPVVGMPNYDARLEQWGITVHSMATLYQSLNPRFNYYEFMAACWQ